MTRTVLVTQTPWVLQAETRWREQDECPAIALPGKLALTCDCQRVPCNRAQGLWRCVTGTPTRIRGALYFLEELLMASRSGTGQWSPGRRSCSPGAQGKPPFLNLWNA